MVLRIMPAKSVFILYFMCIKAVPIPTNPAQMQAIINDKAGLIPATINDAHSARQEGKIPLLSNQGSLVSGMVS